MAQKGRHFKPGRYDLRVKRSRTGRGMFTLSRIPKGACIIEYTGKPATAEQLRTGKGRYLFETHRDGSTIDGNIPSNRARFINHSCAPNCEIDLWKRRVFVFAKRTIKPGEELTYDYDTEYFEEYIKPVGCVCDTCRR
jgi:SET domain-containing protein